MLSRLYAGSQRDIISYSVIGLRRLSDWNFIWQILQNSETFVNLECFVRGEFHCLNAPHSRSKTFFFSSLENDLYCFCLEFCISKEKKFLEVKTLKLHSFYSEASNICFTEKKYF